MSNPTSAKISSVVTSLVMPISLGLAFYLGLNILIEQQVIGSDTLVRYLTGHPISHVITAMFFVGIAGLLVIANNVLDQFLKLNRIGLQSSDDESPRDDIDVGEAKADCFATGAQTNVSDKANQLTMDLEQQEEALHHHYLWQRLHNALRYIGRNNAAIGLEDELKHLADVDYEKQQRRYSLIKIVIWATPMLGFLGTVLGISQALGGIEVGPDNDFGKMLGGLRESLYVAFDTTALALVLSIVLMFIQFLVDRFETQLLDQVDGQTTEEIQRFFKEETYLDPKTNAMERLGRTVIATTHQLVQRQAELWRETIRTAELAWVDSIAGVSETVRQNLEETMDDAMKGMAESFGETIDRADSAMAKRWEQWQVVMSENARNMSQLQTQNTRHMGSMQNEMNRQVESVKKLMEKLDSVSEYQTAVNRNLDALAATSRLHDTLESLSSSLDQMRRERIPVEETRDLPNLRIYRAVNARLSEQERQQNKTSSSTQKAA